MNAITPGPLLARGRTAEVYAWRDNEIIKLFYPWCPPAWVEHEVKNGQIVSEMPLPTPSLIDTVEIDGRLGIIYEQVTGPSMLTVFRTKPWLLLRIARQFAQLQTMIHEQDGGDLPSLLPTIAAAVDSVETLPPATKQEIQTLVTTLPDGHRLCHCDFHPDQVLLTDNGAVIIDWMTAQQGHPLADVARTTVLLMVGQVPYANAGMRAFVNLWRGLFRRAYLTQYFRMNQHFAPDTLRSWMIPVAAARLTEGIPGEKQRLLNFLDSSLSPNDSGRQSQ
jgi:Phosphotransferase enzyme family